MSRVQATTPVAVAYDNSQRQALGEISRRLDACMLDLLELAQAIAHIVELRSQQSPTQ